LIVPHSTARSVQIGMVRQLYSNEKWLVRSRLSAESSPADRLIPALGLRAGDVAF
jgi:hypothetical protein